MHMSNNLNLHTQCATSCHGYTHALSCARFKLLHKSLQLVMHRCFPCFSSSSSPALLPSKLGQHKIDVTSWKIRKIQYTTWLHSIASLLTISRSVASLFRVLFIFPSRYLFAIGLLLLFSFRWRVPPILDCIPKQSDSEDLSSFLT